MEIIEGDFSLPLRGVPKQSGGKGCSWCFDFNLNLFQMFKPQLTSPIATAERVCSSPFKGGLLQLNSDNKHNTITYNESKDILQHRC